MNREAAVVWLKAVADLRSMSSNMVFESLTKVSSSLLQHVISYRFIVIIISSFLKWNDDLLQWLSVQYLSLCLSRDAAQDLLARICLRLRSQDVDGSFMLLRISLLLLSKWPLQDQSCIQKAQYSRDIRLFLLPQARWMQCTSDFVFLKITLVFVWLVWCDCYYATHYWQWSLIGCCVMQCD